jgi:hypothetical protein
LDLVAMVVGGWMGILQQICAALAYALLCNGMATANYRLRALSGVKHTPIRSSVKPRIGSATITESPMRLPALWNSAAFPNVV